MANDKILVVDDEPQILTLVSRFLRREGYDVQTAGSGAAALEHLDATPFALVLSDLKMPNVDGLQVLEKVRTDYPDTSFILMTAYGTIDSAVSVLRRGAYDYLTKPLDLGDLQSTVERALEHRAVLLQNKRLMEFLQESNATLEALHREEQRRAEQLDQVNAIARQITAILDLETLAVTVAQLVMPAFGFSSFSFGVVEGDVLTFLGGDLGGQSDLLHESRFWELTQAGLEPYVRHRASDTETFDLVFPLRAGERLIGFWVAAWRQDAEYRQEDLPYLESLAAQTVTSVENARLYALARRADELAFLNEVGRAANQSLDLETTIHSVLICVRATFNASLVELRLWEEEQGYSLAQGTLRQSPRSLMGERFAQRVRGEAVAVGGPTDVDESGGPDGTPLLLRSLLGVALHFGRQQIGFLGVGSADLNAFDVEDARLLQVVGAQVSTAIENALLFQEVESGRQTILQSRNTLQAVFDGILDGIYVVDRDKRVLAINRTQAGWSDHAVSDLEGQSAGKALPGSRRSLELIEASFRTGEPSSGTEISRRADGRWTEWEIETYPVARSEDTLAGGQAVDRVVVVVRDVTEQRLLEASLARSEKLASLGRLAAGIAHEINNPMTVISANAQILSEEIESAHPYFGSVELIDRASERASRIVRNLLDFSRAEEYSFVPTDLGRSLQDAVSLIEPQLRRADVGIQLDLDPDVPPVLASPDHLHVVWLNLLLNARDAVEEVDRERWVRASLRRQGEHVVVRVSDNGIGIPSEQLERIYDPFFTTKPPGKGTGLGLFTCYRTVQRHGGEINVDSQVGVGTSFDVILPVWEGEPEED